MALRDGLTRIRRQLKRFAYSGVGRDRWQHPDRVVAELGLTTGQRVADVGAGGGYFTFRLADAVGPSGRVYAVDPDPDMRALVAETAARNGRNNVVTVAASPLDPTLPEPVDVALMVNAFHHLPDTDRYLRTLLEYIVPGGRVAVVEARPRRLLSAHATEPETIATAMTAAGFVLSERHDFLPRQSFQVFDRPAIDGT